MTREDLVRIARTAVAGIHRPADLENPVTYDPDEWVLEALAAAWKAGAAERAKDFVELIELVAYIESMPCFEVSSDEISLHYERIDGVTGARFVQAVRDFIGAARGCNTVHIPAAKRASASAAAPRSPARKKR